MFYLHKLLGYKYFLLALIVVLSVFLRFYQLSSTPISLNPDELAIGYNAYSILTTGADEWGDKLPLTLKSFGDWKLPVYPITVTPLIKIIGLNELAVRIPSAAAGVLMVILIYNISLLLFKNKKIATISALFMAVSPWAVFFSRGAYEPNFAVMLYMAALFFFLKFIANNNSKFIITSSILFGLTLFTYHPFLVFTPLFILVLVICYKKEILRNRKFIYPALILLFFGILTLFSLSQGSGEKLSSVGVFNNANVVYQRAEKLRSDPSNESIIIKKLLYNKYVVVPYQIGQNYLLSFSPAFLFDGETTKLFYSIGSFGYLYLIDAFFIFAGIIGLILKKEKANKFLLLWFLIAPISSAITVEAPSVTRLIQMIPLYVLLSSYGAYFVFEKLKERNLFFNIGIILTSTLLLVNFIYFLDSYFVHMNYQRARFFHYGYKEAVLVSNKYPGYKVVMVGPQNFPYISFLFYKKYDPNLFRKDVSYYPPTHEGFYLVKSFGEYSFVYNIDRKKLRPNILYIDNYVKGDKNIIFYPTGEPQFSYFTKEDIN